MSPNFVDTFDFKKVITELVVRLTYSITQKCLVWLGIILKIAWKISQRNFSEIQQNLWTWKTEILGKEVFQILCKTRKHAHFSYVKR